MFQKSAHLIALSSVVVPALLLLTRSPTAERAMPMDAITAFEDRVATYVALHRQSELRLQLRGVGPDSSSGATFREALRDSIQVARRDAQAGDIFYPALAPQILRIVRTDLAARQRFDREAILEDMPQRLVRVNDRYPPGEPLATMPPLLLLQLPPLAEEVQYRFIGYSLILLDVDASLVVDVLPDALPRHP